MKHAALGFRAHSGWTAVVALSLERDQPRVLLRQRPQLVETFTYEFRQPYHTAKKMAFDKAREFLSRVESGAERLAEGTIRAIQADLRNQGYEISCYALLLASTKSLPQLDKILRSHALIHTADGELFRRALTRAGGRCHIAAFTVEESHLLLIACKTLHVKEDALMAELRALGKVVGAPWSQDEKFAALAAWLALRMSTAENGK